jgi:hypothetical protein
VQEHAEAIGQVSMIAQRHELSGTRADPP